MWEFVNQNTEIQDQFNDKGTSNCLRRRFLEQLNLTLEKFIGKAQAMELAENQSITIQPKICRLVWQG